MLKYFIYILIATTIFQANYAHADNNDLSTCLRIDDAIPAKEIEKVKSYLAGNSEREEFWLSKGYLAGVINDYNYIKDNQSDQNILVDAFYVSLTNNSDLAHKLLPLFSNINMYSENMTPLMMAVSCNRPEIVEKIIEMGGDVHLRTENLDYDILSIAILAKANDLVNVLIKHGINCKTSKLSNGLTAIELARRIEATDIIETIGQCLEQSASS